MGVLERSRSTLANSPGSCVAMVRIRAGRFAAQLPAPVPAAGAMP